MKCFLVIILFFCGLQSFAQIRFGIKAGVGLSKQIDNQSIYPLSDIKYNRGILTGCYLNLPMFNNSEYFFFQPELLFVQKGSQYSGNYDFGFGEVNYLDKTTLDYFEIPLSFKFLIPTLPFFITAGGYGSYFLGGYNNFESEDIPVEEQIYQRNNHTLIYDAGVHGGIGIQKGLGSVKFVIDARYSIGLVDVAKSANETINNSYVSISIDILLLSN